MKKITLLIAMLVVFSVAAAANHARYATSSGNYFTGSAIGQSKQERMAEIEEVFQNRGQAIDKDVINEYIDYHLRSSTTSRDVIYFSEQRTYLLGLIDEYNQLKADLATQCINIDDLDCWDPVAQLWRYGLTRDIIKADIEKAMTEGSYTTPSMTPSTNGVPTTTPTQPTTPSTTPAPAYPSYYPQPSPDVSVVSQTLLTAVTSGYQAGYSAGMAAMTASVPTTLGTTPTGVGIPSDVTYTTGTGETYTVSAPTISFPTATKGGLTTTPTASGGISAEPAGMPGPYAGGAGYGAGGGQTGSGTGIGGGVTYGSVIYPIS